MICLDLYAAKIFDDGEIAFLDRLKKVVALLQEIDSLHPMNHYTASYLAAQSLADILPLPARLHEDIFLEHCDSELRNGYCERKETFLATTILYFSELVRDISLVAGTTIELCNHLASTQLKCELLIKHGDSINGTMDIYKIHCLSIQEQIWFQPSTFCQSDCQFCDNLILRSV
jgi:hypothetical protein